jgi:hypothetical protein
MKKEYFLLFVVGLIIIAAIILRVTKPYELNQEKLNQILRDNDNSFVFVEDNLEEESEIFEDSVSPEDVEQIVVPEVEAEVEIFYPQANDLISSPLNISGQARGFWFFEASLPVRLTDLEGNLIAEHYAQAREDWMTTEFVPLSSSLIFSTTATSGYLIIAKDNPSGLPEHDAEFSIPVMFNIYE